MRTYRTGSPESKRASSVPQSLDGARDPQANVLSAFTMPAKQSARSSGGTDVGGIVFEHRQSRGNRRPRLPRSSGS